MFLKLVFSTYQHIIGLFPIRVHESLYSFELLYLILPHSIANGHLIVPIFLLLQTNASVNIPEHLYAQRVIFLWDKF